MSVFQFMKERGHGVDSAKSVKVSAVSGKKIKLKVKKSKEDKEVSQKDSSDAKDNVFFFSEREK